MRKLGVYMVVLWWFTFGTLLWSDTVVLKNGSKISGEVIVQKEHYKIITKSGPVIVSKKEVKAIYPETPDETAKKPEDILKEIQTVLEKIKESKDKNIDKKTEAIDEIVKLLHLLKDTYKKKGRANQGKPNLEETIGVKRPSPVNPTQSVPVTPIPPFFGDPIPVKQVVFVIDISASMGAYISLQSKYNRLGLAKKELRQLIKLVPEDFFFNIVTFRMKAQSWKNELVAATEANKKSALKFIRRLKSGSATAIRSGLNAALSYNPDVIYIITDGIDSFSGGLPPPLPPNIRIPINVVYVGHAKMRRVISGLKSWAGKTGGKLIQAVKPTKPGVQIRFK